MSPRRANLFSTQLEALGGTATAKQREATGFLVDRTDGYLTRARGYQVEFEEQGGISDPEFDSWFKTAQAFANVGRMTHAEMRAADRIASKIPGPRE